MFNQGFRKSKCKSLVMIIISRVTILRNRRDIQVRQLRQDIAQLLKRGQESSAHIRVESLMREQRLIEAYDIIQQFCERIPSRIIVIEKEKDCPMDLQEAVESLIYAASLCADLKELLKLRDMFAKKYGNRYITSIAERHSNCKVNSEMISKLSPSKMAEEEKDNVLREIASEYNINWQPQVPLEKPPQERDLPQTSTIEEEIEFWSKITDADESERLGGSSTKHKQKKEMVATKQAKAKKENSQAIPKANNSNPSSSVVQQARDLHQTSKQRFDQRQIDSEQEQELEQEDIVGTESEEFFSKISHEDGRQRVVTKQEKAQQETSQAIPKASNRNPSSSIAQQARDLPKTSGQKTDQRQIDSEEIVRTQSEEERWSNISHEDTRKRVATKQAKAQQDNSQAIPKASNRKPSSSIAQQARDLPKLSGRRTDQRQIDSDDIVRTENEEEWWSNNSHDDSRQRVVTKQAKAQQDNSQAISKASNRKPSSFVAQHARDLHENSGQRTDPRQIDSEEIVRTESEEEWWSNISHEDTRKNVATKQAKAQQDNVQAIPKASNRKPSSSIAQQARDLPKLSGRRTDQRQIDSDDVVGTESEEELWSNISHEDIRQRVVTKQEKAQQDNSQAIPKASSRKPSSFVAQHARDLHKTSGQRINQRQIDSEEIVRTESEEEWWSNISHEDTRKSVATKQAKAQQDNAQAIPKASNRKPSSSVAQQARNLPKLSVQRTDQRQIDSDDIVGTESQEELWSNISHEDTRQRVVTKQEKVQQDNSQAIPKASSRKPSSFVAQHPRDLHKISGQRIDHRQIDSEEIVGTESEEEWWSNISHEDTRKSVATKQEKAQQDNAQAIPKARNIKPSSSVAQQARDLPKLSGWRTDQRQIDSDDIVGIEIEEELWCNISQEDIRQRVVTKQEKVQKDNSQAIPKASSRKPSSFVAQHARDLHKTSGQRTDHRQIDSEEIVRTESEEEWWSNISPEDTRKSVATKQAKAQQDDAQAISKASNRKPSSSVAQQARDLSKLSVRRTDQRQIDSDDIVGTESEEELWSNISHEVSRQRARDLPKTSRWRNDQRQIYSEEIGGTKSEEEWWSNISHEDSRQRVVTKQAKAQEENSLVIPMASNKKPSSFVAQQAKDLPKISRQRTDQRKIDSEEIVGTKSEEEWWSNISHEDSRQRVATKQTRAQSENSQAIPKTNNRKPSSSVVQQAWELPQTSGQRRTNQRQTNLEGIDETESEEKLIYSPEDSNRRLHRSSTKKKQEQILLKNCIKATEEAAKLAEQAAVAVNAVAFFAEQASFKGRSKEASGHSVSDESGFQSASEANYKINNMTDSAGETLYSSEVNCSSNIRIERQEGKEHAQFNGSYQSGINSSSSNQLNSLSSKEGSSNGKKNPQRGQKSEDMTNSSSSRINTTECQSPLLGKSFSLQHQPRHGLDPKARTQSGPLNRRPQRPPDFDELVAYFKQLKLEKK